MTTELADLRDRAVTDAIEIARLRRELRREWALRIVTEELDGLLLAASEAENDSLRRLLAVVGREMTGEK